VTSFNLDTFVARLRQVATDTDAHSKIKAIIQDAMADPSSVQAGMPDFEENDVILHEDETISIWHCRFMPGHQVPAHDHKMSATIGVYRGAERNIFFENDPNGTVRESSDVRLGAGQVLQIGPNAIHAVACDSPEPCCGIHVYLGALTKVERSLFDVERGEVLSFTDANYERLTHPV
jgi:predicted metal-dependent enzyme (double-stranded beta helix superfamily)